MIHVTRQRNELLRMIGGELPSWIRGRAGGQDRPYLPVFALHSVERGDFERKLAYLRDNDYRTIGLDEVVGWMRGRVTPAPRSVALTIDDGRVTTWSVAYPLLKKYGFTATAFIVPGYVPEGDPRPTLEDVWAGRADDDAWSEDETEDRCSIMNWSEIAQLHGSGVIAIESHTMLHRLVVTGDSPVDFLRQPFQMAWFDFARLRPDGEEPWTSEAMRRMIGAPLPASTSVLATREAWSVNPAAIEACVRRVERGGGDRFFAQRRWRGQLMDELARHAPLRVHRVATLATRRWELEQSKRLIESRLPGKTVRHLCLPRGLGNEETASLVHEAGYESCVWTHQPADRSNGPGDDPYHLGRIKHDYIERLPGRGRSPLAAILLRKMSRRLRGQTGY